MREHPLSKDTLTPHRPQGPLDFPTSGPPGLAFWPFACSLYLGLLDRGLFAGVVVALGPPLGCVFGRGGWSARWGFGLYGGGGCF